MQNYTIREVKYFIYLEKASYFSKQHRFILSLTAHCFLIPPINPPATKHIATMLSAERFHTKVARKATSDGMKMIKKS